MTSPPTPTPTRIATGEIVMSGEQHRAMLKDYSSHGGTELTGAEIALKYDMPVEHFMAYKRVHGFTHNTVPLTNEQLLGDSEKHIDELLAARKHNAAQAKYTSVSVRLLRKMPSSGVT